MRGSILVFLTDFLLVLNNGVNAGRVGFSPKSSSPGAIFSSNPSSIMKPVAPALNPPSYGWNVNSSPSGSSPINLGLSLGNRLSSNSIKPPAYFSSNLNHPAFNPNNVRQPAFNPSYHQSKSYNFGNNDNSFKPNHGSIIGQNKLSGNTYIRNSYYGRPSSSNGFLINALFFSAILHSGPGWGNRNLYSNSWTLEDDRTWRETTKAPYFENKVPGSEMFLPAAAVVNAATAFGLDSLLPLNIPAEKPLMYCNGTNVAQNPINLESKIYSCVDETIVTSCLMVFENSTDDKDCIDQIMKCDDQETSGNLYCTNGTLLSQTQIVCNSTSVQNKTIAIETTTILNCYFESMAEAAATSIPVSVTGALISSQLSWKAKANIYYNDIVGTSKVVEKPTIDEDPIHALNDNVTVWTTESLTIPPETHTSSTEAPFIYAYKVPKTFPNGTFGFVYIQFSENTVKSYERLKLKLPDYVEKIAIANEAKTKEVEKEEQKNQGQTK